MTVKRWPVLLSALFTLAVFGIFSWIDRQGYASARWWLTAVVIAAAGIALIRQTAGLFGRERERDFSVPAYLPRLVLTAFYGVAVLIAAIVGWGFLQLAFMRYLILHLLVLALFLGALAVAEGYRRHHAAERDEERVRTDPLRRIRRSVESAAVCLESRALPEEAELLRDIRALCEQLRYSDPVSHPSLVSRESDLLWQAEQLEACVRGRDAANPQGNRELAARFIQDIAAELSKRNRELLAVK